MKYAQGDEVLARHPVSDEFYKGRILTVGDDQYKIEFEPGSAYMVPERNIKSGRQSRSTTRMSMRVGRKSPSRYSPSRRSPSKRSPARVQASTRKIGTRTTKQAKISLSRIDVADDKISDQKTLSTKSTNSDDSPTEHLPLQSRLKELGIVTRRSARLLASTPKPESDQKVVMLTRDMNRAVSLPVERRSQFQDFMSDGKERGHSVHKDPNAMKSLGSEEMVLPKLNFLDKLKKDVNIINEPQEWGGRFGALLLIILFPLMIILPLLLCERNQCSTDYRKIPIDLKYYFNPNAFAAYLGFLIFIGCASIIPIGKLVDGQHSRLGTLQYRMNGIYCAVASIIIFSALIYKDFRIDDFVLENFLQLAISGWVLGTILSILFYAKASRLPLANLNIYACTNSYVYNFWQGREINPRIGPLDLKIILLRSSLIGMLVVNLAILFRAIRDAESLNAEHLNIAAFLATSLEIFYVLDILIFEPTVLTSFEVMYEGTGYMLCTGHLLYPFLPTLTTKFILQEKNQFSYFFGLFFFCYVVGYMLYRISNLQKDHVRTARHERLTSILGYLETVPTTRGKKLIMSGLWGYVRHPNYLGDIIMQWSVSGISMTCNILPYYSAICCTLALSYRARRDHERCKSRYGLAWESYTSRAKYMILNHVY